MPSTVATHVQPAGHRGSSRVNDAFMQKLVQYPVEPLVMNMSNSLRGITMPVSARGKKRRRLLLDLPLVKSVLLKLYGQIFRWYFDRDEK